MKRFLCTVGLVLALSISVFATDATLEIGTPQAFLEFSELCRYDAYSDGLTVVLTQNIDMTGTGFAGIPIFLGTFDGQGHTITGVETERSMDGQGLFRHVAEGATVSNLTVLATTKTEHSTIGGIAAVNDGTIQNCYYRGMVSGVDTIGGLVGENNGTIFNCTTSGGVFGETKVGGLTGVNHGTILRCTNYGEINTDISDFAFTVEDKLVSNINPTTDTIDIADIGGIAGLSDGIVQTCTNRGTVGYPHVGYNVGGVIGRQSGYVEGCANVGAVEGRKEVGGIVGQFEPHVDTLYSTSKLQKLRDQLHILNDMTTQLSDDADSTNALLNGDLNRLSNSIHQSQTQVDSLLNQTETMVNGNMDSLNQVSVTVADTLDALVPIGDSLEDVIVSLEKATTNLETMAGDFGEALEALEDLGDWANTAQTHLDKGRADLQEGLTYLQSASNALQTLSPDLESITATVQAVGSDLQQGFDCLVSATKELGKVIDSLGQAQTILGNTNEDLQTATGNLQTAMGTLATAMAQTKDTHDLISDLLRDLSHREEILFTGFDETYTATREELTASLTQVVDDMDTLNATANASGTLLIGDVREVTNQLSSVLDLVLDIMQDVTTFTEDETYPVDDVSMENTQDTYAGKVSNCQNQGRIEGDIHVGGLVGAMDFNLAFDQEDDWKFDRDKTQTITRQGIAIVENAVNTGDIFAKKDGGGGIVGHQAFGLVQACTASGNVESEEGEYVGGIAGQSTGTIHHCFAKTTLSGVQFVGGIAGSGYQVRQCYSLSAVTAAHGSVGGIVGEVTDDGTLANNFFVSDTLGGLDGISFAGQAEAISYADLLMVEGLPDCFRQMTLTFCADGDEVDRCTVDFGGSLDALPTVPEKEGCFGHWEPFDNQNITADLTIQAVYTSWLTTIGCGTKEGTLSPILVDGTFSDTDVLQVEHAGDETTLWVEGEHTHITAVRYLAPENAIIQVNQGDQWVTANATREGKYLVFSVDAVGTLQLRTAAVEQPSLHFVWIGAGICAVAVLWFFAKKWNCHHAKCNKV